jgi:hypothetical protein
LPLGALGVGSKCLFPSDKSRVAGWEQWWINQQWTLSTARCADSYL